MVKDNDVITHSFLQIEMEAYVPNKQWGLPHLRYGQMWDIGCLYVGRDLPADRNKQTNIWKNKQVKWYILDDFVLLFVLKHIKLKNK